jgi:heterotetrameric sarcosine oxidase gamma subunit
VDDQEPVARGPIAPSSPAVVIAGWELSAKPSTSRLRLVDCSACDKILVRAGTSTALAQTIEAERNRIAHDQQNSIIAQMASDLWLIIDPPCASRFSQLAQGINESYADNVVDVTHAYAMIRIYGADSAKLMTKLCAIDFSEKTLANGSALRTSIAGLVSDLIRDDLAGGFATTRDSADRIRSYVLLCERSAGKYLFDALLDAGSEFEIDVEGFARLLR